MTDGLVEKDLVGDQERGSEGKGGFVDVCLKDGREIRYELTKEQLLKLKELSIPGAKLSDVLREIGVRPMSGSTIS